MPLLCIPFLLWLYNNAPIACFVRAFMDEDPSVTQLFDILFNCPFGHTNSCRHCFSCYRKVVNYQIYYLLSRPANSFGHCLFFYTELSSFTGYFSRVLFTLLATSSTGILPFSPQCSAAPFCIIDCFTLVTAILPQILPF